MSRRPRIAISLGDPCGIGPELLLRSLAMLQTWAEVTVVGSRAGLDLLEAGANRAVAWRWTEQPVLPPPGVSGLACGLTV
ncbi:MAG TPA: 4-hydroxythreonine-4-phosphate dehydrogenase, partial [Holophagaceae bacterium]|nr:4-hydroxythreonine-4-phosphate dehydrogenase [Holophagaceae bacterium]